MLSVVGIITLSSFGVKNYNLKKVEVELQTWYYTCPNGDTGSFLMPRGSTRSAALEVISAAGLCD